MAELVAQGRVSHLGLSEASATLRRRRRPPITAQWTRDIEGEILGPHFYGDGERPPIINQARGGAQGTRKASPDAAVTVNARVRLVAQIFRGAGGGERRLGFAGAAQNWVASRGAIKKFTQVR